MGLLDRLLGGNESLGTYSPNRYRLSETPGTLFGGRSSGAGVDVDEDSALSLSAVFAGVNILSNVIAALPLSVFKKDGDRREVATNNPAQYILHTRFNPEMSSFVGRRTMEFHRNLWGNAYAQIEWDHASRPKGIWPIEPWRIQVKRDKGGRIYYVRDGVEAIRSEDMIHETLISADGVRGQSFIDYAVCSLGLSIAAQTFSEKFFGNGARPGGLLVNEGNPTKEQRAELRESWERTHAGPENAQKTGVIWGGWKYDASSGAMTPEDSQLIETRRFGVEEVARWLNLPPHILRDLSRSTNNNIEHQGIEFVQLTLGPILTQKEQEYDHKLLSPPKIYSRHNVNGLLRGDSAARADFYTKMLSNGSYTINRVLDLEDENPIGADGDVHFVPVNMQPIERAINPPEPPAPIVPEEEPEEELPVEPSAEMRAALHSLVSSTFTRLMRKELNEGRRAAKKPSDFLAWLDSFYPEFNGTLAEALTEPLRIVNIGCPSNLAPAATAAQYCHRSRETLLELSGNASAANLAEKVEAEFAAWEANRANDETDRVLAAPASEQSIQFQEITNRLAGIEATLTKPKEVPAPPKRTKKVVRHFKDKAGVYSSEITEEEI